MIKISDIPDDETPLLEKNTKNKRFTRASVIRIIALCFLVVIAVTFVTVFFSSHEVQNGTLDVLKWTRSIPTVLGAILFAIVYALALVLFCPGTPFNLAAGFLFDIWIGSLVALCGCIGGACIAFLCGRTIARDWVAQWVSNYPKFRSIDWAISNNGIYIVFLTRLSPLFPFPLLNYGFGVTKVSILNYFIGTAAGVLPSTVGYTYIGTAMRDLAEIWSKGNTSNLILLFVGIAITLLSIVIITFITRRAINKATKEFNEKENSLGETP